MRYDGTRATLRGRYGYGGEADLTIHNHRTGGVETVPLSDSVGGHGGGDAGVMRAFVRAVRGADRGVLTSARASLDSHLLAFAAERSRMTGGTVDMAAYRAEVESSVGVAAALHITGLYPCGVVTVSSAGRRPVAAPPGSARLPSAAPLSTLRSSRGSAPSPTATVRRAGGESLRPLVA